MVLNKVPGQRVTPAVIDKLLDDLRSSPRGLVHFMGHGEDEADRMQSLLLEQDQRLRASAVPGFEEIHQAFTAATPLVVLNACEVGRPTPALRGAGGLAQALIDRGAGGVVAALWSVAEDPAYAFAQIFYEQALENPPKPFAEILREIRKRAYEGEDLGEDTFAAYCFYGDPQARRE
jgi:CHAT domain-containing protein